ncbi:MAG: hypothetical protein JJE04_01410 [Acidobacteriia bacterium]|nr:hypothetical protein [Terriglobia bacterium]
MTITNQHALASVRGFARQFAGIGYKTIESAGLSCVSCNYPFRELEENLRVGHRRRARRKTPQPPTWLV